MVSSSASSTFTISTLGSGSATPGGNLGAVKTLLFLPSSVADATHVDPDPDGLVFVEHSL